MCFRRKAILMIHGFVGGCYDYGNFDNELQVYRNFDVFTFTLPGHDKMVVKDVKYQEWITEAENQINFLINHNYKEIYLIGHSMGGVISAYLASKYTQVKKLVLVAPAFRYFCFKEGKINIRGINDTIKSVPELFKEMGTEYALERIAKTPLSTTIEFTKLVSEYEHVLEHINCPVLTIRGTNDKIVPQESTELVYNTINSKTNKLINIKNVNHNCLIEKRNHEIKEEIIKFLKKRPNNKKETLNI